VHDEIIEKEHSTAHWGRDQTIEIITRNFYINNLYNKVAAIISRCNTCQQNKNSTHKRYRLLNPLDVPSTPWESI
jgi:hypothetical protein